MATTKGPLFSLEASGSIGNALTYGRRGKTNTVKTKTNPANPRSLPQIRTRAAIAYATALWNSLTNTEKAAWAAYGEGRQISGYNAMTSQAAANRAVGMGPQVAPSGAAGPTSALDGGGTITVHDRNIEIAWEWASGPSEGETTAIIVDTVPPGDPTNPANAVFYSRVTALEAATAQAWYYIDGFPPGNYTAGWANVGENGVIGNVAGIDTFVIA